MQNYEVLKLQGSQTSNMQATGLLESKRISVFCFNKEVSTVCRMYIGTNEKG